MYLEYLTHYIIQFKIDWLSLIITINIYKLKNLIYRIFLILNITLDLKLTFTLN